jgi:hypothetical protein
VTSRAAGILVCLMSMAGTASSQEDRRAPPSEGGRPVVVAVGFTVLDFARVTPREESFDVTGTLSMSWRDPRLARPGESGERWVRVDPAQVWTPKIVFLNAVEQPKPHNAPVVEVDARGNVSSWFVVSGKFSTEMDVHGFPFDTQALEVRVSAADDATAVRFEVKPEWVGIEREAFLSDWKLLGITARAGLHRSPPDPTEYAEFVAATRVRRHVAFYLWRVLLPLTLLVAVSWAVFWFEPTNLQPLISTCLAVLISLVAFNIGVDFALPKMPYLTLIDVHALIGFAFVAAAVVVVAQAHRHVVNGQVERAVRLQKSCRVVFPILYAIAVAANIAGSMAVAAGHAPAAAATDMRR